MHDDIRPGGRFPDYELPDQDGKPRRLSALQGSIPMVLHLSRGSFCPKEQRFVGMLAAAHADFRVAYTRVVVITIDDQLALNEFRDALGATYPFLSDDGRTVARELDIEEYTDPVHEPMIPHTFVLAPGLEIFSVYNGYWYWGRPSLHELRLDLRAVMQRRVDFDLSAPGLREAWDRGERDRFLVEAPVGEAIRYTEGSAVGVKR